MKLGILGSGLIVRTLMEALPGLPFEKVYLLGREPSRERVEGMAAAHGLSGAFYDYDELLASEIDTVYVALPNALHYAYAKKALERGKDVILEKPAAVNARELRALMALAAEKGAMLAEAMTTHYLPAFRAMKDELPALGRIRLVNINFSQYSSRYDAFKRGETAPVFDPKMAGGVLLDLNVYNIHAVLDLFGRPASVDYRANMDRGVDTSGVLTLTYPDFQAVCLAAKDCAAPHICAIQGDEGTLWADGSPLNQVSAYRVRPIHGPERAFQAKAPEHRMHYEFVEFMRMFAERDRAREGELLKLSLAALEVMDEARARAGIEFENDRREVRLPGE